MGEWKKPVAGAAVSALFGIGTQFADIPDNWKHGFAFMGIAGAFVAATWWSYLHFYETKESSYHAVLEGFLSYNTSDKLPLRALLDCGVLNLKTEKEADNLLAEIAIRRGYDPFPDFVAVPDGKKLKALTLIRDRQIAIEDPQQMMDFLASINDIARGRNLQ